MKKILRALTYTGLAIAVTTVSFPLVATIASRASLLSSGKEGLDRGFRFGDRIRVEQGFYSGCTAKLVGKVDEHKFNAEMRCNGRAAFLSVIDKQALFILESDEK